LVVCTARPQTTTAATTSTTTTTSESTSTHPEKDDTSTYRTNTKLHKHLVNVVEKWMSVCGEKRKSVLSVNQLEWLAIS